MSTSPDALGEDFGAQTLVPFGAPSEDILLECGDEDLLEKQAPASPRSLTVERRFVLTNRVRRSRHELTLFQEGYLRVRRSSRARPTSGRAEALLDLRYLDPRPVLSRVKAPKMLRAALALTAVGALLGTLAYFSIAPLLTLSTALLAHAAAGVAAWLFVLRSHERVVLRTNAGKVPVLTLQANLGCIGCCRALVPHLVSAIAKAQRSNAATKAAYLRQEMREHYRLRETGVCTDDLCATGTRRILAQFD